MTPQPAGHSRHTVAYHEATPGTIWSLGTTRGRMVSVACWHPPLAAAAPDAVTILKKSRLFIYRLLEAGSNRGWRVIDTGGSDSAVQVRSATSGHGFPNPIVGGESWIFNGGRSRSRAALACRPRSVRGDTRCTSPSRAAARRA